MCFIKKISDTHWHIPSQSGNHFPGYTITKLMNTCRNTKCKIKCKLCGELCYHLYKCDDMCYDYMNRNLCKHLHRIHSLLIGSAEEVQLNDTANVETVVTTARDETVVTTADAETVVTTADVETAVTTADVEMVVTNEEAEDT